MEFLILKFQIFATIFMSLEYFLDVKQKEWIDSLIIKILYFFKNLLAKYILFLTQNLKISLKDFLKSIPFVILYTVGIISIFILIFQPFSIEFIQKYHNKEYWIYITLTLWALIAFLLWKITNHSMKIIELLISMLVLIIPVFLKIIIWFLLFVKKGPLAAIGLLLLMLSFYIRYQNL